VRLPIEHLGHGILTGLILALALTLVLQGSAGADESSASSTKTDRDDSTPDSGSSAAMRDPATYKQLIDELEAERRHVDALERKVKALESSNSELQQTTTSLSTGEQQLVTQSGQFQKQITDVQKTVYSQLGPFGFGDRINSFLGQHTFTMVGGVSAGFYFDRQSAMNQPAFDFEVNPMIRLNDWLQFYASIGATVEPGDGISALGPSLANLQIFPLGQEQPLELVAGLFDIPFGDWYENQSPNWVNPFVTAPLLYGAEAIVPPSSMGLQARGGIQWGQLGQDFDYTVWADSGPSFESAPGVSAIPAPVVGEALNPLTGTNLATNGKGFGGRFRFYPLPIEREWGRLELMATAYNGKWLDGLWYESWGVGYAYRVGPFRTRGEWAQSYRQMPSLSGGAAYPGCCGHDDRQGWYAQFGYFLYGIPHPDLGDWLEPRFNKTEFLVRYSGVNQRAILANDISTIPVFGFNGSPSVFSPHAREVALALDYWIAPSIVWMTEVDFELPRAGGTLYNFPGSASVPVASGIGATPNDVAVMTQLAIGF
jgi:exonuclease VII small subunit